jgi:hypothetical protein
LSLDLSSDTGQTEAAIKSLLGHTALTQDKAESAKDTWKELILLAAQAIPVAKSFSRFSGYGQAEDLRKSKEAGFDHHLIKPADMDQLQALIMAAPHITKSFSYGGFWFGGLSVQF